MKTYLCSEHGFVWFVDPLRTREYYKRDHGSSHIVEAESVAEAARKHASEIYADADANKFPVECPIVIVVGDGDKKYKVVVDYSFVVSFDVHDEPEEL